MTSFRFSGTLLAVATLLAGLLTTAFATPAAAELPMSTLTLTVQAPAGELSTVRLHCDPPGGSHPDAEAACDHLGLAGGDFSQLEQQVMACTMDFRPVTAVASGTWQLRPVLWREKFSNPCTLLAATGPVFDF